MSDQHVSDNEAADQPQILQSYKEDSYEAHIADEGWAGPVNQHPDGCFFCGSGLHHSDCCPHRP